MRWEGQKGGQEVKVLADRDRLTVCSGAEVGKKITMLGLVSCDLRLAISGEA